MSRRPQAPQNDKVNPKAVTEGMAPSLHQAMPVPPPGADPGTIAQALDYYKGGRPRDLPESSEPLDLAAATGPSQVLKFPPWLTAWFTRQSAEKLAALDRLAAREMRRAVVRELVVENWARVCFAGGLAYSAVRWGIDALLWIREKLPAIESLWAALRGGG